MPSSNRTTRSRSSTSHMEEAPTAQNLFINQNDGSGRDEFVGAQPRPLIPPHFPSRRSYPTIRPARSLHPSDALRAPKLLQAPCQIPSPKLRGVAPRRHHEQTYFYSRARNFSSEAESQDSAEGSTNPFGDSCPPSRRESDEEEGLNTQTVAQKYDILPSSTGGLLVFPEDIEHDDYLHNPSPDDKDDNDCHVFSIRAWVNIGGAVLLLTGLVLLLFGYTLMHVYLRKT